ncbi:hypothetical protein [uncultured Treponema sp.]|uniref:LPD3 domain-containing protein n=2 Tax=uncultured Treponema sp. TaxID=162155 RepID=UPI0025D7F374|nr:hypothetical protein [uncultured Treponema sp.]
MENKENKNKKLSQEDIEYIHSEEFINKFGDWEKANRLEKLKESEPLILSSKIYIHGEDFSREINQLREKKSTESLRELNKIVTNIGKEILSNIRFEQNLTQFENPTFTIKDTNEKFKFNFAGIKESSHHNLFQKGHIEGIANISEIIENSYFIGTENNEDNRKPELKAFHYYASGIKIDGEDFTAKVVFTERKDGQFYYDQSLSTIEKGYLINNLFEKNKLEAVNPINRRDSFEFDRQLGNKSSNEYYDKRLIRLCQVPQLPYMEFNSATKQWFPTKETIKAVKENRLFVEKVGQEYQMKINDITNKSNTKGATAMNENEKSAVKKMDEELEKTILREHQEMEELEAEAAVSKAVDESVQNITEENDSESLLEKILDDKEKKEKENILEEEKVQNNVFLLNRNDELSNEVDSTTITDSVFSANESERSVYDEIPKIFEDLNTHFNESVREKENWDFRYKGIKIGEVSKDGSIKFCENKKLSELNLDLEKIKEQISLTSFAKRENFSFEENCNLGEDKREEKYVKMFEEQQKIELEKEIDSEEMKSESFAKDFAQKIQSANLEEVNSLFNNAREQNIDMSEISDFRDEKGNNVLHLAAKNPNLTPEMLTVFHKNLGAEKSTELYFVKNKEEKIPLDVSRSENFLPDKNVIFEKTFGSKKQFFDMPKPFTAMSIGSSVALEFEKNKNPDKFNIDDAAFNSVMKKSLQDQMTQRKNLIENWDFRNDSEGIAQAFENKGVSFDEKTRSNIISYDFVHFAGGEKKVLDRIKLSENKDGLSILESSNTNLTALVERNFKIEKDKNYKLFRDISNTTAFMNVSGRNEPTPNYKEFPQDYMKQNGYFPPMLVQNARNENGEKSVLVAGKDEFGNPCEYRMNETQISNIIHNSMNYAAKNGEKVDFLKDKNVVPLSHIDFIKNHDPNADIGTAFRDSLNSFEKQHQTKVFAPFVKEQEFKQKMEQEANLEKAKKLAYEQNQTLGGMER